MNSTIIRKIILFENLRALSTQIQNSLNVFIFSFLFFFSRVPPLLPFTFLHSSLRRSRVLLSSIDYFYSFILLLIFLHFLSYAQSFFFIFLHFCRVHNLSQSFFLLTANFYFSISFFNFSFYFTIQNKYHRKLSLGKYCPPNHWKFKYGQLYCHQNFIIALFFLLILKNFSLCLFSHVCSPIKN